MKIGALEKADKWACSLWVKAIVAWQNRSQDHNYRKYVARPSIRKALKTIFLPKFGIYLDFGCGDGSETKFLKTYIKQKNSIGIFYGFDRQRKLVQLARDSQENSGGIKMIFSAGSSEELVKKFKLKEKVDLIFSTFLLQDLPDINKHIELIDFCLKKGGGGIFLLVHPDFGEAMRKKNVLHLNPKIRSQIWDWAAEYPIVEESGMTFYVPYFQRSLKYYETIFKKYFSIVNHFALSPSAAAIKEGETRRLSPFFPHAGNVYYPEIIYQPSSLIFKIVK